MNDPIEYSTSETTVLSSLPAFSNVPIFASDLGTKGAKRFYSCGYDHFIQKLYPNNLQKHEYEVLQWNKPTKIFFDLDCSDTSAMTYEAFVEARNAIVEHVREQCLRFFDEEFVPVYILDSFGAKKHSSHLIFDIVLENMEDVKRFVSMVYTNHPIIDMSVYSRNRCFRIMGSSKRGSTCVLTPIEGQNPSVFQTLVQAVIPETYTGSLRYHNHPVHSFTFSFYSQPVAIQKQHTRFNPPEKLSSFVSNVLRAKIHNNSGKEDDKKYSFLIKGLYCPFAQKIHKSNNAFLNINKDTMNGWIVCADNDCPKVHFWNMNFLYLFV